MAMTKVGDMERAEEDNMLQMSFNITNATSDGSSDNQYQIQMQTGLLSQSYIKYNIYSVYDSSEALKATRKELCYTGYVHGADDEAGWYDLASRTNLLVAAKETTPADEQTFRNLFAPTTLTDEISLPGEFEVLEDNLNERFERFNTLDATNASISFFLLDYDIVYENNAPNASLMVAPTTTTTATTGGNSTGRRFRLRRGAKTSGGCGDVLNVQQDKFFYGMLHWHNKERKPTPGSNDLVFPRAVRAAASSMAVVSPDVDIACFLSQYRDDVQPLMMTFDQMKTWSQTFLGATILFYVIFIVFGFAKSSSTTIKLLYTLVLAVGSAILIGYSWHLKSQVGAVIDGVKHAVSTVDCQSEHIGAVYENDDSTHAETYYMVAFGLNIGALVLGLGTYLLAGHQEDGAEFVEFDVGRFRQRVCCQ
jgi:hypothetical protein